MEGSKSPYSRTRVFGQYKPGLSSWLKLIVLLLFVFGCLYFTFELHVLSDPRCFQRIPYVYFIETGYWKGPGSKTGKLNSCDKYFRSALTQATISNGVKNVVLLGSFFFLICSRLLFVSFFLSFVFRFCVSFFFFRLSVFFEKQTSK